MQRNMLVEAADRFWFSRGQWLARGYEHPMMRELAAAAFEAGARWNFQETAKLSPHIARFLEMAILLGPTGGTDDATEVAHPYWHAAGDAGASAGTARGTEDNPF